MKLNDTFVSALEVFPEIVESVIDISLLVLEISEFCIGDLSVSMTVVELGTVVTETFVNDSDVVADSTDPELVPLFLVVKMSCVVEV